MMKNSRKRKPEPEAEKPTLDALLQEDPAYQEAFDQKVNQLLRSARTRWEREQAHQPDEEEQLEGIRTREQESVQLSREREALEQEKQDFPASGWEVAVGQELQKRGRPPPLPRGWPGTPRRSRRRTSTPLNALPGGPRRRRHQPDAGHPALPGSPTVPGPTAGRSCAICPPGRSTPTGRKCRTP